jgi:predicted enzyme related to lactoylglutathione lyase
MSTLRGLTTMVLTADDVEEAAAWYSGVLGIAPYFRQPPDGDPAYIEFRIGPDEDELGIMSRSYAPDGTPTGSSSVTYWFVDDVAEALADLVARGATVHAPVTPRGEEFVTASVTDPFGNVLGLMHSPHWLGRH